MMDPWFYTLRKRFSPESIAARTDEFPMRWQDYLTFSGFLHLQEVVTLDGILCPEVITELLAVDWEFNVHQDFRVYLFREPKYLLRRQRLSSSMHQIIAVSEHPDGSERVLPGFTPCGFDLMDEYLGNSTLTNCGPMPEIFDHSLVNEYGLISDLGTAVRIRDQMRQRNPHDPHLRACEVWALARLLPN